MLLEICASSIQSALNAQAGDADRVELCQNLEQGGITPSYGLIQQCKPKLQIPVFVLIRPRPGNFIYDANDVEIMKTDIEVCRSLGCEGVVFGSLDENNEVDIAQCRELIAEARPMQVTFHRAFDECKDQMTGLETLIELGFDRVLTTGGAATALEGMLQLQRLIQKAENRIIVLAGGGINADNIEEIMRSVQTTEFHASAKQALLEKVVGHQRVNESESTSMQSNLEHIKLLKETINAFSKTPN